MIGWMIVRDGRYHSPMGYVPSASHAQWFRTREEALQGLADLRRENLGIARGADVQEVNIPGEGFGSALGGMTGEYNPWDGA